MRHNRRDHLNALMMMAAMIITPQQIEALEILKMEEVMPGYGLISQIIAQPGKGEELAQILKAGSATMPGNFGYVVGQDKGNADALWVVEIWQAQAAHIASLQLVEVRSAIKAGRPLIAGFGPRIEFEPFAITGSVSN